VFGRLHKFRVILIILAICQVLFATLFKESVFNYHQRNVKSRVAVSNFQVSAFMTKSRPGSLSRPVTRGRREGEASPRKIFAPLEKCVGHSLKLLDTIQKISAPLRKFFAPPGVPSWLRAWVWARSRIGYGLDYIKPRDNRAMSSRPQTMLQQLACSSYSRLQIAVGPL